MAGPSPFGTANGSLVAVFFSLDLFLVQQSLKNPRATYLPCKKIPTAGFEAESRRTAHLIDSRGRGPRMGGAKIAKLEVEHQIPARKRVLGGQLDHYLVWSLWRSEESFLGNGKVLFNARQRV
jgi:hypothetical protein